MGNGNLPALINVGNYVYKFNYSSEVSVETSPYNLINNLFITKQNVELTLSWQMVNKEYKVKDVLIDGVSFIDKANNNSISILALDLSRNYHVVEIVTETRAYTVTYIAIGGGQIEIDGELYTEYTQVVPSGTIIIAKAVASVGYTFITWSDIEFNTNNIVREDEVLDDLVITAEFEKLNKFNLYVNREVTINEAELNAYITWTKTELVENDKVTYVYTTFTKDIDKTDILAYLNINPVKKDYIFKGYNIYEVLNEFKVVENEFNIYLNFEADYVYVFLNYDYTLVNVEIVSAEYENNLSPHSNTSIVVSFDDYYKVLNGYRITIKGTPISSYLTKITANDVDLVQDYSIYANSDMPFEVNYLITNETEINIEMNLINVITILEFDSDIVSVMLKTGSINALNEVILPIHSNLEFTLSFVDGYELEKFEVYDSENNLLDIQISLLDDVYGLIVNQNMTIKIYHKETLLNIEIYANEGGEVLSNVALENIENSEYNIALKTTINYKNDLTIFANPSDNYIISNITLNGKTISNLQVTNLKQIIANSVVVITFEKVETWLDENENGDLKFVLSTFKGLGTQTSPYIISSINHILTIAYKVNVENMDFSGVYFKTSKPDLELDFEKYYFNAIGNDTTSFNGVLIGDNLTLKNIKITGGENVGLFKTLGENALIKGVQLTGSIVANDLVGSVCGTNNGTIEGVYSNMTITTYNGVTRQTNIVGGICAINNGTITRSYYTNGIASSAVKIGGISGVNNSTIENIYNEGHIISTFVHEGTEQVIAGIVAENNGTIKFGYNNSRVYSNINNASLIVVGTCLNKQGNASELYFNSKMLTSSIGEGKTYDELKGIATKSNPLYANWDFNKVWYFKQNVYDLPKLNIAYEYKADITFSVEFSEGFNDNEKLLLVEVSNGSNLNYAIMLSAANPSASLKGLPAGTYTVKVTSLLGSLITIENSEITLLEGVNNAKATIKVTKTSTNGYYAGIVF